MQATIAELHATPEPSWPAALAFRFKAACFRLKRAFRDFLHGPRRHPTAATLAGAPVLAEWPSDLWRDASSPRERPLQLGKVQNLRLAARAFDGLEIPAGEVWSFWKQLGRTTRSRGFAEGRELREGCLIPTIGGGLCQISGAIYNAALAAGFEIVERHAHSNPAVGSLARLGRDATIFWNYVDLRLRASVPWRLEVRLTSDQLHVRLRAAEPVARVAAPAVQPPSAAPAPNSCATCGIGSCFRHRALEEDVDTPDRLAVLVDEWQPEFATYLKSLPRGRTLLCRPMDGIRWRKANYAWPAAGYQRTAQATFLTLRRAWASRRLREQGAERQRALLAWDERLARDYARRLGPEHTHLLIAQPLLPFLWRDGVLGGRTFDVLMSRLPMAELHNRLDQAARLHPEFRTCADFRADPALVAAETQALAAAHRWITPHREIARLAGARAYLLEWQRPIVPEIPRPDGSRRVLFPAGTLCRKGAVELRAAARELHLEVLALGGILEGADFWQGVPLVAPTSDWLAGAAAVVLPAFVEHRPRRLLAALAAGVPVIATPACGLEGLPGVTTIPAGDAAALTRALESLLRAPAMAS